VPLSANTTIRLQISPTFMAAPYTQVRSAQRKRRGAPPIAVALAARALRRYG
jgi:hypothetical protein